MSGSERSDALVFFGATGDLAYKKIFPALYAMVGRGALDVPIIGVARSGWTLQQLRERARASVAEHGALDETTFDQLAALLRYIDGDYNDRATFEQIRHALDGARRPLHYLAIPPSAFPVVIEHLGATGCSAGARVIVEKPFGRDLASAKQLNATLHAAFDESAVFRIDHYLGKETVQNLMVFRFENTFLEPIWNRQSIASVQVTMAESFGVHGRGAFYDEAGAIRDVVENHMMQILGFLCMEPPIGGYHEAMRDELVKVFRQVRPLQPDALVRGQFRGYRDEPGVNPDSNVETFAAMRLQLDSWRWAGVPFFLRAGKSLAESRTEVIVRFHRPPLTSSGQSNHLRLQFSPELQIALGANVKQPGAGMTSVPTELSLVHDPRHGEVTPYERLLGDAMEGDATLFARQDAVEACWSIFDDVLAEPGPVRLYDPGSWGPAESDALTASVGGWAALGGERR